MTDETRKPPKGARSKTETKPRKRKSKRSEPLDLLAALDEPVAIRQDGKTKKASAYEVGLRQQVMSAVAGKIPAIRYVLRQAERFGLTRQKQSYRSVVVVPKDMPDELQDEIFDFRFDENGEPEDGQLAAHRMFCAYAKWFDLRKAQKKESNDE